MRAISSLSSGLPARDHGFRAAQVAGIRPDIKPQIGLPLAGIRPWQWKQLFARIGRTSREKSS